MFHYWFSIWKIHPLLTWSMIVSYYYWKKIWGTAFNISLGRSNGDELLQILFFEESLDLLHFWKRMLLGKVFLFGWFCFCVFFPSTVNIPPHCFGQQGFSWEVHWLTCVDFVVCEQLIFLFLKLSLSSILDCFIIMYLGENYLNWNFGIAY